MKTVLSIVIVSVLTSVAQAKTYDFYKVTSLSCTGLNGLRLSLDIEKTKNMGAYNKVAVDSKYFGVTKPFEGTSSIMSPDGQFEITLSNGSHGYYFLKAQVDVTDRAIQHVPLSIVKSGFTSMTKIPVTSGSCDLQIEKTDGPAGR